MNMGDSFMGYLLADACLRLLPRNYLDEGLRTNPSSSTNIGQAMG